MGNKFEWVVASGAYNASASWSLGTPGDVPGPPTSTDNADIATTANVSGNGVAYNLYFDAPVTISSGLTTTVGDDTVIGDDAVGSVTVSSTWSQGGYLRIGGADAGTLTIDAGGDVANTVAGYVDIGRSAGAEGTLTVQGGGQFSTNANYLTLGVDQGSSGVATISGPGSTVTIAGAITVGYLGGGQVTVSDGGSLITNGTTNNNFNDTVGYAAGSTGSVTVTGANSSWKSANDIQVAGEGLYGGSGTGLLAATDGGFIQSAQGLNVYTGGTISVDSTSVIEAGTAGGAQAGYLTLDANTGGLYGDGTVDGNVIDNSNINAVDGGPMTIDGTVSGDGGMGIGAQGDLVLDKAVTSTGGVGFYGWFGTLALGDPGQFDPTIYNFMPGDTIDLTNLPYEGTPDSYSVNYSGPNGPQLTVTEGSTSYTLNVSTPDALNATLKLVQDAGRTGTDVVFASTPASPFNLWSTLSNFFSTSTGPVNDENWALSNVAGGGNPIWVDTEAAAGGYPLGSPGNYTIVMTSQDWLGTQQPLVTVATDTDFTDTFRNSATQIGNLAGATIFSSNGTTGDGAVLYWGNSATPGEDALELQPITTTFPTEPSTGPDTVLTGSPVTLLAAVLDPTSWTFNKSTSTSFVVAYTTAASPTTENLWYQAFSNTGAATSPDVEVGTNIPDSTQYYVAYGSSGYEYRYTEINGSQTGLYGGSFNTTTGVLGPASELLSLPSFTSITGVISRSNLSSGNSMRFIEGAENGQPVIQAFVNSDSTPTVSFNLSSVDDYFSVAPVSDPNDGANDYTVLAYTDNNQVHLELLNELGQQIGSDFVVPGITSFDQIHTLSGNGYNDATRVEIDYTTTDPSGGTEIKGLIYDTIGEPYNYTLSGGGEYIGTPFDDGITDAPGTYTVDGGGGKDNFFVNYNSDQVSLAQDAAGDVTITISGGVSTLERFSEIYLSDSTVQLVGDSFGVSGTVDVNGSGSAWTTAGTITVGNNFGEGSLSATAGGLIQAAGGIIMIAGSELHADPMGVVEAGSTGGAVAGYITIDSGAMLQGVGTTSGQIQNNGEILANGGAGSILALDSTVSGTGNLDIAGMSELELGGAVATGAAVNFEAPNAAVLAIDFSGSLAATIGDFDGSDSIDLKALGYVQGQSSYTVGGPGSTQVTVHEGTQSFDLLFASAITTSEFNLQQDGDGTEITVTCYCSGTLIQTEGGEVAVENLAIGDKVVTQSGEAKPIKWIGHRSLVCSRQPDPRDVWPIRVAAGAFGANKPSRDLWLSPGHNIVAEGVLIPIGALQNGKSIVQHERATVDYWHVELDEHDILIAEGLPAESYLDTGNRTAFVNGGSFIEAHPDFRPKHWKETCIPLVKEGLEVARTKAALLERLKGLGRVITLDADIHLIVDGKQIEPVELSARRFAFALPAGGSNIRLMSRTFIPAHTCPENTDTRSLGICVGRLQIDGKDIALDGETLLSTGWREPETGWRWTRGSAALPPNTRFVMIDLAGDGYYWQEPQNNAIALFG